MAGEGWQTGFESINQLGRSSEVERYPKMSIYFFGWREVVDEVQVHDQPGQSSEVEGGGVHQPEPKCQIDLRFQLFHYWGGVTSARTIMSP